MAHVKDAKEKSDPKNVLPGTGGFVSWWFDLAMGPSNPVKNHQQKTIHWDVLLVLRINGLFHPYISRLDTSPK